MSALLLPRGLTLWDGLSVTPPNTYETSDVDLPDFLSALGWQLTVSGHSGDLDGTVEWQVRVGPDEPWVALCPPRALAEVVSAPGTSIIYTIRELGYRLARLVVGVSVGTGDLRLTVTGKHV